MGYVLTQRGFTGGVHEPQANFSELLMASPSGKGVQIVIVTKLLLRKWA